MTTAAKPTRQPMGSTHLTHWAALAEGMCWLCKGRLTVVEWEEEPDDPWGVCDPCQRRYRMRGDRAVEVAALDELWRGKTAIFTGGGFVLILADGTRLTFEEGGEHFIHEDAVELEFEWVHP
jgi:hypothetical protein